MVQLLALTVLRVFGPEYFPKGPRTQTIGL